MVFRSKIDPWLLIVVVAVTALPLFQAMAALRDGSSATPHLLVFVLLGGFFLWLLLSTKYTIDDDAILVQSGPFSWRIVRTEITGIVPSKSMVSSPALSLDRIRIDYGLGRKSILISPKDKDRFLNAIAVTSNAV
jgi:energy-coupling factor transporter transmembrane protein EcfT